MISLRIYEKDKKISGLVRTSVIVLQETEKKYGNASLILPKTITRPGVVLVHGFSSSPAELKGFGRKLADLGHPVLCVRLKGHGTSPWDLRERSWFDWQASVQRGFEIMSHISGEVLVVGFATGASLALLLAAKKPRGLAAVISVSAPIKFRLRNLRFAPLLDHLNRLGEWVYVQDGIKPFQLGEPEHPEFEYCNIPVRALVELGKIAEVLQEKLPEITCPVTIIHGSHDPFVNSESATIIHDRIGSLDKKLHIVTSDRHGVLHEDIDNTQSIVIDRLSEFVVVRDLEVVKPAGFLANVNESFLRLIAPLKSGRKSAEPTNS